MSDNGPTFDQIIHGHRKPMDPITGHLLSLFFTWLAGVIITTLLLGAMFTVAPVAQWAVVALAFGLLILWAVIGAITERVRDQMEATK